MAQTHILSIQKKKGPTIVECYKEAVDIIRLQERPSSVIGRGAFGTCHSAIQKDGTTILALKHSTKGPMEQEVAVLRLLAEHEHQNILQYVGHTKNMRYMWTEFLFGKELLEHMLETNDFWTEDTPPSRKQQHNMLDALCQIFEAVAFLHERDVTHGDLKPENMIIRKRGPNKGRIVIIDFGHACAWREKLQDSLMQQPEGGTEQFAPPEEFGMSLSPESLNCTPQQLAKARDIWALGIISLLFGRYYPWNRAVIWDDEYLAYAESKQKGTFTGFQQLRFWPPSMQCMLHRLLELQPHNRKTMQYNLEQFRAVASTVSQMWQKELEKQDEAELEATIEAVVSQETNEATADALVTLKNSRKRPREQGFMTV